GAGAARPADDHPRSAGAAAVPSARTLDLLAHRLRCGVAVQPGGAVACRVLAVLHGGCTAALRNGVAPGCAESLVALGAGPVGRVCRTVALAVPLVHARQSQLAAGQYCR